MERSPASATLVPLRLKRDFIIYAASSHLQALLNIYLSTNPSRRASSGTPLRRRHEEHPAHAVGDAKERVRAAGQAPRGNPPSPHVDRPRGRRNMVAHGREIAAQPARRQGAAAAQDAARRQSVDRETRQVQLWQARVRMGRRHVRRATANAGNRRLRGRRRALPRHARRKVARHIVRTQVRRADRNARRRRGCRRRVGLCRIAGCGRRRGCRALLRSRIPARNASEGNAARTALAGASGWRQSRQPRPSDRGGERDANAAAAPRKPIARRRRS